MLDSAERLVNLALFLASARRPVTAEHCRSAGIGYPQEQDSVAFIRMFERDKDALRAAGLVIEVSGDDETEAYRLDAAATFARPVALSQGELASVRAVAAAFSHDPGFPFRDDLALALAKLGAVRAEGPFATTELPPEAAEQPGEDAQALAEAVQLRKQVTFEYTNAAGECRSRTVQPFGMFFREGLWYLTARDTDADDLRTFAVARMRDVVVNAARPRTPDFERPEGFDIREQERLPFQYGPNVVTARLRFDPAVAFRAERLSGGRGSIERLPDGSALLTVEVADIPRLASWIVDGGSGIHPLEPPALVEAFSTGLREVVRAHG